jgi:hypothetical protein
MANRPQIAAFSRLPDGSMKKSDSRKINVPLSGLIFLLGFAPKITLTPHGGKKTHPL